MSRSGAAYVLESELGLYVSKSLVDAKGDILVATANDTPARLPVGADGKILKADSAAAAGVSWGDAPAGGGGIGSGAAFPAGPTPGMLFARTDMAGDPLFKWTDDNGGAWELQPRMGAQTVPSARLWHSTTVSLGSGGFYAVAFDSELFDTDSMHDTATNNTRLTCKTPGLYRVYGEVEFGTGSGARQLGLRVNGTTYIALTSDTPGAGNSPLVVSTDYRLAAGDYVELVAYQNSGVAITLNSSNPHTPQLGMTWLGGAGQTVDERGVPTAKIHKTAANQALAGAWTQLTMGTVDWDTDGMTATANALTIKTPGLYHVRASVNYTGSADGANDRGLNVFLNGAQLPDLQDFRNQVISANGESFNTSGMLKLAAGDVLTLMGFDAGGKTVGGASLSATLVGTGKTVTPYANVRRATDQSIPNAAEANVSFDLEDADNDGIHDTITNADRLVCRTAGVYMVTASVVWQGNANGVRDISLDRYPAGGGASVRVAEVFDRANDDGSAKRMTVTGLVELAAGDYVALNVYQSSGGALGLLSAASGYSWAPQLAMVKVGAPNAPAAALPSPQADVFTVATLPPANTFPNGRIVGVSDGAAGQQARMAMNSAWINLG